MTPMTARRTIAVHESQQLRNHPVRLWPIIRQEAHAMLLLHRAGRPVHVTALTLDPKMRVA